MYRWTFAAMIAAGLLLVGVSAAEAQQEQQEQRGTISGRVVDEDGNGVEDAQVRVMPAPPRDRGDRPRGEGRMAPGRDDSDQMQARPGREDRPGRGEARPDGQRPGRGEGRPGDRPRRPDPVATGETDEEGRFSMSDVPAGEYVVVAMARGVGMGRERVSLSAGGSEEVEIVLRQPPDGPRRGEGRPQRGRQQDDSI